METPSSGQRADAGRHPSGEDRHSNVLMVLSDAACLSIEPITFPWDSQRQGFFSALARTPRGKVAADAPCTIHVDQHDGSSIIELGSLHVYPHHMRLESCHHIIAKKSSDVILYRQLLPHATRSGYLLFYNFCLHQSPLIAKTHDKPIDRQWNRRQALSLKRPRPQAFVARKMH